MEFEKYVKEKYGEGHLLFLTMNGNTVAIANLANEFAKVTELLAYSRGNEHGKHNVFAFNSLITWE